MKKIKTFIAVATIAGCVFIALWSMHEFSKEPEKPKRLVEVIADNIREHTADWTFVEAKDTTRYTTPQMVAVMGDGYSLTEITWENKKCGIKILMTDFLEKYFQIVSPDSLALYGKDTQILWNAYNDAVQMPLQIRSRQKYDSLDAIEKIKALAKEKEILNKICTQ